MDDEGFVDIRQQAWGASLILDGRMEITEEELTALQQIEDITL